MQFFVSFKNGLLITPSLLCRYYALNEISHGGGRCGRGGRGGHGCRGGHGGQGGGRCDGGTGMHMSRFFKKLGLNSRSCGLLKIG